MENVSVAGPAVTVECTVGNNIMSYKAIYFADTGDILVGDDDGVVAAPKDMVAEVLRSALEIKEREAKTIEDVKRGREHRGML